ncbi:MAG: phosphatidylserine/phosphatidylglycerophosphate/cardiolipin synthase family protein [Candidatus Eremiobacteraeota bacterium]|nr:phosphatidylserine/phosphatidylglycerophosphate/cardiolipin synthase family protein [Candidatus Eremiobacteraeota bacterium]
MSGSIDKAGSYNGIGGAQIKKGVPGKQQAPKKQKDTFQKGKGSSGVNWDKIPANSRKYFKHGNKVSPLLDGQVTPDDKSDDIFHNIEQMIRGAKKSVQIEMFSLDRKNIVDLLIADVKRGVKVQVIMDPPDQRSEKAKGKAIKKLRKNGVDVLLYPVKEAGSPEAKYGQIDHVKMMIVDGKKAIIGGMNWGEHSKYNRDVDVQVEGPAVDNMEWLFRKDWLNSGGKQKDLPWIDKTPPHPEGESAVQLLTTGLEKKEQTIGFTINRAIKNARKSIHTELFVLTRSDTVENLIDAHERGLDVRVVLDPLKINGKGINEKAAEKLKEAGVPVKWYVPDKKTKSKLHAKIGIFDDDQVILGSANWSYAGFNINREAGVEVLDTEVNSTFDKAFENDWKLASEDPQYLKEPDNNPGG